MNGNEQYAHHYQQPAPQKKSNVWKWLAGCGCGCLVIIIIIVGASMYGVKIAKQKIEQMSQEFVDQGYTKVVKHVIEVNEDVTEKTVYLGQIVKIMADCHDDIAIIAQVAEIYGTVNGKVSFRGQVLNVQPNAVVNGNIDVTCQVVQIYGDVQGEITGKYQQIVDQRKTK